MAEKKTVAVIGGGPSGLTTAKSMLEAGLLPTVFEARRNVGGLWAPPEDGLETHQLDPRMKTNASHYSSCFSDYFPYSGAEIPNYPTASFIWEYVKGYASKYLPEGTVRLGCPVLSISSEGPEGSSSWRIVFRDEGRKERVEVFSYLVVCTGVFSNGYIPHVEELKNFKGQSLHSSQYVGEKVIFKDPGDKRKILVVGGALSGAEISADIALRISSLSEGNRSQFEIFHLFSRPFWIIPKTLPFANEEDRMAPKVLPLDQVLFTVDGVVNVPPPESLEAKFLKTNGILKSVMGSDQGELGPEYHVTDYWSKRVPRIGVTGSYGKFVSTGIIKPIRGKFGGISTDGAVRVSTSENGDTSFDRSLEGIDTIIFATGYTPWPALQKIFAPGLLLKMGLLPGIANPAVGLLNSQLYKHNIHPALGRTIGFMGIAHRPFWGLVEIQGRWLASLFAGKMQWPTEEEIFNFGKGIEWLMSLGKVEDALLISTQGGYLEVVSELGKRMGINPLEFAASASNSPKPFIPAHLPPFCGAAQRGEHSKNALRILHTTVTENSVSSVNLSIAIFAELQGKWKITRTLSSKLPGFPDGEFVGLAEFHPRLHTFSTARTNNRDGSHQWTIEPPSSSALSLGSDVPEYLYIEEGDLTTNTGMKLHGKRRYIYQYDETVHDKITAWFVKPGGTSVDYFFHDVDFTKVPEKLGTPGIDGDGGWKAASEHLCEKDWYWPAYRFVFKGARLNKFWIRYKVLGPDKDYISEATYVRA